MVCGPEQLFESMMQVGMNLFWNFNAYCPFVEN